MVIDARWARALKDETVLVSDRLVDLHTGFER